MHFIRNNLLNIHHIYQNWTVFIKHVMAAAFSILNLLASQISYIVVAKGKGLSKENGKYIALASVYRNFLPGN